MIKPHTVIEGQWGQHFPLILQVQALDTLGLRAVVHDCQGHARGLIAERIDGQDQGVRITHGIVMLQIEAGADDVLVPSL